MPVRLPVVVAAVALLAVLTATPVFAQAIYGTLAGRVLDSTGAPIPDASVTVVDTATNAQSATTTGPDGTFRFTRVTSGQYRLVIEKTGFRQHLRNDILVTVNEQVLIDAVLEVGSLEERVVVDERSPIVQAKSAEVSGLVDQKRVRELPLNGGNFQRLAVLAPGAAGGGNNNPSFSGSRSVANSFTLDGSGFNDERGALGGVSLGGGAADFGNASPSLISTEAIREFRVITSNADATFGRGSGAQVNVLTRSGTNSFKGSGYYFGRNDALDARDFFNYGPYFDDQGNAITPPFKQHLFGATLGGPLARDRHFFFSSTYYEEHPDAARATDSADVTAIRGLAQQDALDRRIEPILEQYHASVVHREAIVNRLRFLSPPLLVYDAVLELAGTSTTRVRRFAEQVDEYHREWRAYFYPLVHARASMTRALYEGAPRFTFREEPIRQTAWRALDLIATTFFTGGLLLWVALARLTRV
jgi:Domain of unknown function (DUF3526)/Carboxypeptidase regulatory-like domain